MTSRDVVNKVCRKFNTKSVGHIGTLDPLAEGVLVCLIGKYTKLANVLVEHNKEYIASFKLGILTDTLDITGNVLKEGKKDFSKDEIINALNHFKGTYNQEVPIYSAVKVNGKKLYEYARAGIEIERQPRPVEISSLTVKHITDNEYSMDAVVSSGTYIRTLIEDYCTHLQEIGAMSYLLRSGIEDFDLTILYGNRTRESILLRDELDAVAARSNGRVKIVHVLSDEEAEGYEHGFITAELIKKYAGDGDYSLFLCGPKAMYAFADTQIAALGLPRRRARKELYGDYGDPARSTAYPASAAGKTYTITVTIRGETQTVSCRADQTLLSAMEQAGIKAPSRCRSGECGWCHSLLLSGEVFVPAEADGRREADKKFGWIHPCCTYPLSDVALDVPALI